MTSTPKLLAKNPTTELTIPTDEEVVQFTWRKPEVGDAGVIIGGTPSNPLKRKDLFYLVLEIVEPITLNHAFDLTATVCLVTDRTKAITTKERINISYFISAERPVPDLFTDHGIAQIRSMLGSLSLRQLVDHKIIV